MQAEPIAWDDGNWQWATQFNEPIRIAFLPHVELIFWSSDNFNLMKGTLCKTGGWWTEAELHPLYLNKGKNVMMYLFLTIDIYWGQRNAEMGRYQIFFLLSCCSLCFNTSFFIGVREMSLYPVQPNSILRGNRWDESQQVVLIVSF